jgi:hypothetical protein
VRGKREGGETKGWEGMGKGEREVEKKMKQKRL